jgi:hypothetical protein
MLCVYVYVLPVLRCVPVLKPPVCICVCVCECVCMCVVDMVCF